MSAIAKHLATVLRQSRGLLSKADIGPVVRAFDIGGGSAVPVGDDCAAIEDADGYTLLAIEGFMNEFVAVDPWFAGWCGVMVNISDIAAMGGRPLAVVDALWADGKAQAAPVLAGMKEASLRFGVTVVGGHTNMNTDRGQLAVAILGRAKRLLTSFDAAPGDLLIAAIDLRGAYREPFSNFDAATAAPAARLREDLEILPRIAESSLANAAKDISQGGIVGTAAMFAECSAVAVEIDINAVPRPPGIPLDRWLTTFPSYGYLIAVHPSNAEAVLAAFAGRDIAAAIIGMFSPGATVSIRDENHIEIIHDFADAPLIGCGPAIS